MSSSVIFKDYTKNVIIKGFITALLFSAFIYLEYFDLTNKLLNTVLAIISYILIVTIDKKSLFFTGFFIGILWFWWIGYSFIYYELIYLIPFVLLGIGFIYGFIFYLTAIIDNILVRIILVYCLTFIEPFGFNWFKIDLPLINTYFNTYASTIKKPNLNIYMPKYSIPQDNKWDKIYQKEIISTNLTNIDFAISKNYDIVILPETSFPLLLNKTYPLLEVLKYKSKDITIITGALSYKNNQYLNSTYMFQNQKVEIANKVVLVPFGEKIPLPKFMVDFINNTFFNGASDYHSANKATTFTINDIKFRNAICYEATTDEIYKNLDTKFIIASSNNAWFTPSIEPTLQKLLLRYYAKKYNLYIYHSTNMSDNMIIK
ncbi:MAG: apolipoprotein N-acyltransferase [Arcobacteraceae bacterium]|nr:apolipoprotein N-acyltransferase [Arcobacteraceae bacterium]